MTVCMTVCVLMGARGADRSVGYSHLDVGACVSGRVRVGFTPEVLTDATADLALALLLATARRVPEAATAARTGAWSSWKPLWMTGKAVAGSTVGIVGMGRIGQAIARRLAGFGCTLLYTGAYGHPSMDPHARSSAPASTH